MKFSKMHFKSNAKKWMTPQARTPMVSASRTKVAVAVDRSILAKKVKNQKVILTVTVTAAPTS